MLKNITFLHFITIFYNFDLKIEVDLTARVVKPILGTRSVKMYVCICIIYIFSKNQGYKVKKNYSKCV